MSNYLFPGRASRLHRNPQVRCEDFGSTLIPVPLPLFNPDPSKNDDRIWIKFSDSYENSPVEIILFTDAKFHDIKSTLQNSIIGEHIETRTLEPIRITPNRTKHIQGYKYFKSRVVFGLNPKALIGLDFKALIDSFPDNWAIGSRLGTKNQWVWSKCPFRFRLTTEQREKFNSVGEDNQMTYLEDLWDSMQTDPYKIMGDYELLLPTQLGVGYLPSAEIKLETRTPYHSPEEYWSPVIRFSKLPKKVGCPLYRVVQCEGIYNSINCPVDLVSEMGLYVNTAYVPNIHGHDRGSFDLHKFKLFLKKSTSSILYFQNSIESERALNTINFTTPFALHRLVRVHLDPNYNPMIDTIYGS